ncbi:neuropeptide Y receptor type 2-like [Schistocerca gregaria]|uniref:neuropeptide Y receptor type 2-like n=1 Tax=Schistocerca gregaria TaxID=7010 RepID=UPI00211ED2ED|nr:neuropeptide Y receptor type 2-like [Schistocerca gregaria]
MGSFQDALAPAEDAANTSCDGVDGDGTAFIGHVIRVDELHNYLLDDRYHNVSSQIFNFTIDQMMDVLRQSREARNVGPGAEAALIAAYCLLAALGLAANGAVAFVVARRAAMRTPRNLYIANLTASDFSLCLVCMPFTLVSILRREWTMGALLCKLVPALQGANIMVSVGTITVIALDRYFTIVRHSAAHPTDSRPRVILSIVLTWLLAVVAITPILFFQVVERVTLPLVGGPGPQLQLVLYEACIERWPSRRLQLAYAAGLLLLQAVLPAAVLATVHARIARYLHAHANTAADSRRARRELRRNRRTTLLLSGVAVLFVVSWLPQGLYQIVMDLGFPEATTEAQYLALAACHITAMTSAVSNPIVYGWLNSNIRHEFMQLLPSRCKRVLARPTSCAETGTGMGGGGGLEDGTTRTQLAVPTANSSTVAAAASLQGALLPLQHRNGAASFLRPTAKEASVTAL